MVGEIISAGIRGFGEGLAQGIGIALIAAVILLLSIFGIIFILDIIILIQAYRKLKRKHFYWSVFYFIATTLASYAIGTWQLFIMSPMVLYLAYLILKRQK